MPSKPWGCGSRSIASAPCASEDWPPTLTGTYATSQTPRRPRSRSLRSALGSVFEAVPDASRPHSGVDSPVRGG